MHAPDVVSFFANLLVILLSAKVFGELAERLGQPAVLGELLGGVFLGFGLFPFFRAEDPALGLMAEFGVVLLLFQTGLESDLGRLLRAGPSAAAVAAVGMLLPFLLGWGGMSALGYGALPSVFVGATLTATSVGITARVLSDMGRLDRPEAHIILGAAVIDDILGLVALSAVQGLALAGSVSWLGVGKTAALAFSFLGLAALAGPKASEGLLRVVERMRGGGVLVVAAVCFALAAALLAQALGSALIVGAFTAGVLLARTDRKVDFEQTLKPVSEIFVPVFFVMAGVKVHPGPGAALDGSTLLLAALLIPAAVLGKLASGWAARGAGLNRWGIGLGMVPRGEVGLIFAQAGLTSGALGPSAYAAVLAMVVATTFLAPPLLKRAFR